MKLIVLGKPIAKGRPRLGINGTYTPSKTVNYENLVKLSYMQQINKPPLEGALSIDIKFYFPIPKSYTKKKKTEIQNGTLKYVKKPDIDNCIKSILDGLNELAFKDDNQVFEVYAIKKYSENPRVEIEIKELT